MQIQQCFGEGFRDPVTRKEYEVHKCWVVSTKTRSNSGRRSLESALRSAKLERHVKPIDGDMLWRLIGEFSLPSADGSAEGVTTRPDGALWFAESPGGTSVPSPSDAAIVGTSPGGCTGRHGAGYLPWLHLLEAAHGYHLAEVLHNAYI
jgi:hypothetical protein